MVEWSIAAFRACESVGTIVVACPPGHAHELEGEGAAGEGLGDGDLRVVDGGEVRSASVANALEVVETELVAIHDAARPMLTPELVAGLIATLDADPEALAAIPATPVTDTIKRAAQVASIVEETLERSRLWAVQTPQVFRVEALRSALTVDPATIAAATDEAMLVEEAGGKVLIHPSPPENLKVTTPLDLRVAELLLSARAM
jgi:2-C-methyl-D-erythritol 4-phosphate cytidylyltransferase